MADSSFWDAATDFTAEEAVELAVAFGCKQSEFDRTKIKSLYERMERSYYAKRTWHQMTDEMAVSSGEFNSVKPDHMLESIEMRRATEGNETRRTTYSDPANDSLEILTWLGDQRVSAFEIQRFSRDELALWFAGIGMKSRYPFESNKPITPKGTEESFSALERTSLLKMVIAMAIRGYGYVPTDKKSTIPKMIEDEVLALDMEITDDTVRKYLKEAVQKVLPGKPHGP